MSRKFDHWIDRGFWALGSAVALYIGGQMKDLSESVNALNTKLSVYIARSDNQAQVISDHESRIRAIEARVK